MRIGDHVDQHAQEQHRVGVQRGQVGVEGELDVRRTEAQFVHGREHAAGGIHPGGGHGEHARLHAAHVEQIGDQRRQRRQTLVGGGEQLFPIGCRQAVEPRRPPIAATAEASGRRRSWLTADSRALRT